MTGTRPVPPRSPFFWRKVRLEAHELLLTRTAYPLRGLTGEPPTMTAAERGAAVAALVVRAGGRWPTSRRRIHRIVRRLQIAGHPDRTALTILSLVDRPDWPQRAHDPALMLPATRPYAPFTTE